ncbi:MAG: class I SAM-dependent methyltransferase [Candidatus Heimdallarchaeota archaeon]
MSYCLITLKKFGEFIREEIDSKDLLSASFRIKVEDKYLIIPIERELTKDELSVLSKTDSAIKQSFRDDLEPSKFIPKSHFDVLQPLFSEKEMELTPRSFDTIGDIIVIEIPEELADKKEIIGNALLTAHTSIKTVYAKAGKVEGINRIRPVEYLVGEKKTKTIYKEHGIRLAVDITQAYFSPRLSEEHSRIANKTKVNETIVDLFCGIGPFAIPIAKKVDSQIHAIDINPGAIALLQESITLNKLLGTIVSYCGDCRKVVDEQNLEHVADRVIMNLPGYAIDFVDVACKTLKKEGGIIHFFEFVGGENPEKTIVEDISREIAKNGRKIDSVLEVRKVRMSAPRQWQMVADVLVI